MPDDELECPSCDLTTTSASALAKHHGARHGDPLPDSFYLDEIRRLADEQGTTPSISDMQGRGRFSGQVYSRRFGSWNAAIEAAGLQPNQVQKTVSDSEIVDEIQTLADDLGRVPLTSEFQERAAMSTQAVRTHFGSWNAAVREAGFLPTGAGKTNLERDDLITAIQELTEELGHPPRVRDMVDKGRYSYPAFSEAFGSWGEAIRAAGLEPLKHVPTGEDHWNWDSVELVCEHCGDEYTRCKSAASRSRFCSYECHNEWRSEKWVNETHPSYDRATLECEICGSEFDVKKSHKDDRRCCSRECSSKLRSEEFSGEDNPRWKGGIFPYGHGWTLRKRQRVRIRDQARCQHCGRTEPEHLAEFGTKHVVHHITPARDVDDPAERNAMENLITLCRGQCHRTWEQMAPLRPDTAAAAD